MNTIARLRTPLIPAPAADPWMIQHDGAYYFCESRKERSIFVRKAGTLHDIQADPGVCVWHSPEEGMNSRGVWAPELHRLNGKWYIYYAADDGKNENHRMWVLEGVSDDPAGEYVCKGCLETDGWAIDGSPFYHEGKLYFVWSGWPGPKDGQQNLYLAPMSNPWTLSAKRTLIAEPTEHWERVDMPICEGPQVLINDGKLFIIYSASGSWTVDYCLGLLSFRGGSILDRANWEKIGPAFTKNEHTWGVGHCSFVKSPCQQEDWILFHAKTDREKGWNDRHVLAQRFHWNSDGTPNFGSPLQQVN